MKLTLLSFLRFYIELILILVKNKTWLIHHSGTNILWSLISLTILLVWWKDIGKEKSCQTFPQIALFCKNQSKESLGIFYQKKLYKCLSWMFRHSCLNLGKQVRSVVFLSVEARTEWYTVTFSSGVWKVSLIFIFNSFSCLFLYDCFCLALKSYVHLQMSLFHI